MGQVSGRPHSIAGEVAAALTDARRRTLEIVADLDDLQLMGPRLAIVNPFLWEIGHLAWFQEKWVLAGDPANLVPHHLIPLVDTPRHENRRRAAAVEIVQQVIPGGAPGFAQAPASARTLTTVHRPRLDFERIRPTPRAKDTRDPRREASGPCDLLDVTLRRPAWQGRCGARHGHRILPAAVGAGARRASVR